MSDSQRPNSPAPSFEVPDLELEPAARSAPRAPRAAAQPRAAVPPTNAGANAQELSFGATFDFGDELSDVGFERSAQLSLQVLNEGERRAALATRENPVTTELGPSWPTGRAANAAELEIEPRQLATLADYGAPPESAAGSFGYAYRVFTRQRQLKRELLPISAECERAQLEREATLAEFSQALRPALEQIEEFRRFLAPLLALEQRTAARGQALGSINAQLDAELAQLDAELAQLELQVQAEQRLESEAKARYEARAEGEKRAQAKLKRVQIEIRAVTRVAEQKLGPQGGQIPDPEAAQLLSLEQRAQALAPELAQARAECEQAKVALTQVHARLAAFSQTERQIGRKKQALGEAYGHEVSARSRGVSDAEIELRAALADLARALLAAPGTLVIPEAWLERVRTVSDRASSLLARSEMYRRALASYDVPRARQGVRLACTAVGLLLVLFAFKLIF